MKANKFTKHIKKEYYMNKSKFCTYMMGQHMYDENDLEFRYWMYKSCESLRKAIEINKA